MISHSRFHVFHLFFSGVPSFPHYLVVKLHLNHRKASPCSFNPPSDLFSFLSIFKFLRWLVQDFVPSLSYQFIRSFVVSILPLVPSIASRVYAMSLLILSTRISSMQKSIACHQFKLVKDKHNVILILVSSK